MVSAAALMLLLSACGASDEPSGDPAAAAAPSVDSSLATAPPNPTEPGRCHTADLTVIITPGGGAAGHHGEKLTFTNASAMPCTLEGFPGVSFVTGDDGAQVGADFKREGDKAEKITLEPGQSAATELLLPDTGAADCEATETRGFRIYPPDETAAIFISSPQQACKETDKGIATVRPLAV
ncbi:DUF4232 domain-containing protein [Catenuloplanes japonicus]|uniref:DUF4232 domain-containing protein n=1 Tax=Catenuloplanes japonicus TaxID=33876 RepID=UPI0006903649|nr:DUF4232 domain-containing protein [Catenuloplanes japonicus]